MPKYWAALAILGARMSICQNSAKTALLQCVADTSSPCDMQYTGAACLHMSSQPPPSAALSAVLHFLAHEAVQHSCIGEASLQPAACVLAQIMPSKIPQALWPAVYDVFPCRQPRCQLSCTLCRLFDQEPTCSL